MKPSNTLRTLTAALTLLAATPFSSQAERATSDQRAQINRLMDSGEFDRDEAQRVIDTNQPAGTRRLSPEAQQKLLGVLEARFNGQKLYEAEGGELTHEKVTFASIKKALEKNPALMFSIARMEETGGAPNLVEVTDTEFVFADTSAESPEGRRNLNYDEAKAMADEMGVKMMDEATYRKMQEKDPFDRETWSWLLTDAALRQSGGALRGRRGGAGVNVGVGVAERRGSGRGWRGVLRVPRS